MPTEPNWSKEISNTTICTWFYALALLNAFFAVAGIIGVAMSKKLSMSILFPLVLSSLLGFTNSWFLFVTCNRSLKD